MVIKYKLKHIGQNIFLCNIDNIYDLCMTFCRVQEFYESPYKSIRGKNFNLLEFMSLYAKNQVDGIFSYPADWVGFNVSSSIIKSLYANDIKDFNQYDQTIKNIHDKITKTLKTNNKNYYLIGSVPKDSQTIWHEVAHGLYNVNESYRKEMNAIVDSIPKPLYIKILDTLMDIGYTKKVIKDEIQAYLSNDSYILTDNLKLKERKKLKNFQVKFKKTFNHYKNSLKINI